MSIGKPEISTSKPTATAPSVQIISDASNNPVGIMTAKPESEPPVDFTQDAGLLAVKNLADKSGVPAFGIRYAKDNSWFSVTPLNGIARQVIKETKTMTATEYAEFRSQLQASPDQAAELPQKPTEQITQ